MRSHARSRVLAAAALIAGAAITGAAPVTPTPGAPSSSAEGAALAKALADRAKSGLDLSDVRIEAAWGSEGKMASASIWGDGVGVWERRLQFRLPNSEVRRLLRALDDAAFPSMACELQGRRPEKPVRIVGQLTLRIGTLRKACAQNDRAAELPALRALVDQVLAAAAKVAPKGVGASGLEDGLRKLENGALAPQALELTLQRRFKGESAAKSFILSVEGRIVTDRSPRGGEGAEPPRRISLSAADFRALVETLRRSDPASLPINPWAAEYADLDLQVLDRRVTLAARPYLGKTVETYGEKQQTFDRLLASLAALHERVRTSGVRF